ncbi:secretion protein HlyD, partial [Sinorhizobium meliloti]
MRKVAILVAIVAAGLAGAWWFDLPRLGFAREPRQAVLYGNVDIRQVSLGFRVSGRI